MVMTPSPRGRRMEMNAKFGDMIERFIDRGRLSLNAMRNLGNEGNVPGLLREVNSLKNASANVAATRVRLAANTLKIFLEGVLAAHDSSQPRSRRPSKELNTYRQPATISFDEESHADAQSMAKRRNEDGFFEKIHQMISRIESEMHSFTVQQEKLKNDALEAAPAPEIENKYAYYDDDESEPLNEKEHEKKLLSWNKEVYESRVFKAFVEERLVRALYTQRLHRSSRETFHHHQQVVARNFQWRHSLPTPYTRKVKHEEHTEQVLAHAMEQASPRFRDIEALSPRLNGLSLVRRGLSQTSSSIAQPASEYELTRSVQLPPIHTLMNPRNQMTSPLPDKETLMPHTARSKRSAKEDAKFRPMQLYTLLKFAAQCFESKRVKEIALMREYGLPVPAEPGQKPVLVPLRNIIDDILTKEHGSSDIKLEKFEQLRLSCSDKGHGWHPRLAIFRRLAGWDEFGEEEVPLDEQQEVVIMQLLSWLGIATPTPAERDTRPLLQLKDVAKMVDHLYRLRLIPIEAKKRSSTLPLR